MSDSFLIILVLYLPLFLFYPFSLSKWHIFRCQIPFLYPGSRFLQFVSRVFTLIISISLWRVFHSKVSWWFLTGVWVEASLLKFSRPFSVFCLILTILQFEWSLLVLLFPNPPVPVLVLWWLYQGYQLQLVSSSLSCSIVFSSSKQSPGTYPSFRLPSILLLLLLLLLTFTRSGRLAEIRWSVCISKSQRILCVSTDSGLCICFVFACFDINFLYSFQWITFPTQSCLLLYSLCANLLYSLSMWLYYLFIYLFHFWENFFTSSIYIKQFMFFCLFVCLL